MSQLLWQKTRVAVSRRVALGKEYLLQYILSKSPFTRLSEAERS